MTATRLLFVCTHNAGRSALGAALARHHGGERFAVASAGVAPAPTASAETIAVLAEIGVDDSTHVPTLITEDLVAASDVVIAMKPGLDIPRVDGVVYETWELPNPEGWGVAGVRELRDAIDVRVTDLLARI
ncbi:low molecular weight phosphatase family protein [Nocardioides sp.]|uniref:arsenate-mycothiol transferase ArsC n=1 Tax=Nocardioides sp. TaxID=35761 RepID=UPI0035157B44